MIRLAILAEGGTEQEFVDKVLVEHLQPAVLTTAVVTNRGRGGNVLVARMVREMARLYRSFDAVTSLVDFYGFHDKGRLSLDALQEEVEAELKARVGKHFNPAKVFPYIQPHEFEALLFSNVEVFRTLLDDSDGEVRALQRIRAHFPTPEDINDSEATAPAKRIKQVIPGYDKKFHGPDLAQQIGLDVIREQCPRFNAWLTRLESLADWE